MITRMIHGRPTSEDCFPLGTSTLFRIAGPKRNITAAQGFPTISGVLGKRLVSRTGENERQSGAAATRPGEAALAAGRSLVTNTSAENGQ
jgi:hypothetical protein